MGWSRQSGRSYQCIVKLYDLPLSVQLRGKSKESKGDFWSMMMMPFPTPPPKKKGTGGTVLLGYIKIDLYGETHSLGFFDPTYP